MIVDLYFLLYDKQKVIHSENLIFVSVFNFHQKDKNTYNINKKLIWFIVITYTYPVDINTFDVYTMLL